MTIFVTCRIYSTVWLCIWLSTVAVVRCCLPSQTGYPRASWSASCTLKCLSLDSFSFNETSSKKKHVPYIFKEVISKGNITDCTFEQNLFYILVIYTKQKFYHCQGWVSGLLVFWTDSLLNTKLSKDLDIKRFIAQEYF